MASLVDYDDDSDEEETPPVACVTEERDRTNNMCSEASSSNSSWLPTRSHFIGMGYSALVVDEAIQEVGSGNENAILEYIRNNQECSSDSDWCLIKKHFVNMSFSSSIVDKALEECGTDDEARILEFLTNYKESPCESSLSKIRNCFTSMGFPSDIVDKAIEERGTEDEALILDFLTNYKESSCESSLSKIRNRFTSMGFPSDIVDKAIEDRGTEDEALILEFVTNYKGSSCESSSASIRNHFMLMGFPSDIVNKAIEERGIEDEAGIFESILTYELMLKKKLLKESSSHEDLLTQSESSVSEVTDTDDEDTGQFDEEINLKARLLEMGYSGEEASLAIERYGVDIPIDILIDSIDAVRHSEATSNGDMGDPYDGLALKKELQELMNVQRNNFHKRKHVDDEEEDCYETYKKKPFPKIKLKGSTSSKGWPLENEEIDFRLPRAVGGLTGFGVPGHPVDRRRNLKEFLQGPPYFYFENVYITPKGVWDKISRSLHNIEPEFVDSKHFSVSCRKRGYVHNLPTDNRFQICPLPPMTINEAFPHRREFWPSWDTRTKLNCINTVAASALLCGRLRDIVKLSNGRPTKEDQDIIMFQCKKWNLVWVKPHQPGPLSPTEMELVLGYDEDHTRVCCTTTGRIKSLGNAFQVDTVGYHLSVLKPLYPEGIRVLSLFSGIGGAEVALHRLNIPLNYVVSAETNKENMLILRSWWERTHQKGELIEVGDVANLTKERLDELISSIGGFDLIIGGSPCNNLTGSNRCTRYGLEGEQSSLFFEFPRIMKYVRGIMRSKRT